MASSRGKPPARGAVVVVVAGIVVTPGTKGVGVKNRNGVGVGSCCAMVSGPAATAAVTCSVTTIATISSPMTCLVDMAVQSSRAVRASCSLWLHSKRGWTYVNSDRDVNRHADGGSKEPYR